MKIGIINCGVGNIGSITNAIKSTDLNNINISIITNDSSLLDYELVILPGVGSFNGFMKRLTDNGMDKSIKNFIKNKSGSLLGICVGMQVLFEFGHENYKVRGLGIIPGEVKKITQKDNSFRLPHVGWNNISFLDKDLQSFNGDYYFTHSFIAHTKDSYVTSTFDYGKVMTASVSKDLVHGFQFHPEKSGTLGSKLLGFYFTKKIINA